MGIETAAAWIALFGSLAAFICFSIALLGGVGIVRRLRLPNDPPADALFSAPAPPIIEKPDRERAQAQAAVHAEEQALLDQAKFICMESLQCREDFQTLSSYPDRNDAEHKALKELKPIHKRLKDIPEQFEAWHNDGGLLAHADAIKHMHNKHEADCKQYQAIIKALPPPSKKRILLLVAALIASFIMLAVAHYMSGL